MAEEAAAAATIETSPMVEEFKDSSPPVKQIDAPPQEEELEESSAVAAAISEASDAAAVDHKRKLEDLDGEGEEKKKVEGDGDLEKEIETKAAESEDGADAKRQRVDEGGVADGLGANGSQDVQKDSAGNGQLPFVENTESRSVEASQVPAEPVSEQGTSPSAEQQDTSRKIEIPNNKVGVLIGKAGETIRLLQNNSGARIQITRDAEADPNSSSRPVELTGTMENISKAEQLIKDVIAEADAGGSPALVARGFGSTQTGSEVHEMLVPNEKVGTIIGKGGETIKNLQTKSQARIQLIPQHLPEGDVSKERTVRITGNKKQIEAAKSMIRDVMNQTPGRPSSFSSRNTQGFRPRGPEMMPQWGTHPPPQGHSHMQPSSGYDYPQKASYPPQTSQYSQQSYGSGYPQQPPPRSHGAGWEPRPAAPVQNPSGYDYYGQGQGMNMGSQQSSTGAAPTSAPMNYYGQPQAAGYGQPNPYAQPGPQHTSYGHGYNEPKYDNQTPAPQMYGLQQQPVNSQQGFYPQQGSTTPQAAYAQQAPYSKPAAYAGGPQSYGVPPRPTQPGDPIYPGGPTQQSYPYGQSYAPATGVADAYNQQPPAAYSQPSSQVAPSYGPGGQPVPAYTQPGPQSGGYGQYPAAQQPTYGEQPAPSAVNYGYQGPPGDGGYGSSAPNPGYGQTGGYAQQPSANSAATYDQSMPPQAGYGSHPGAAPVGYTTKGVSPQPGGYGGQYDSVQMYGHH